MIRRKTLSALITVGLATTITILPAASTDSVTPSTIVRPVADGGLDALITKIADNLNGQVVGNVAALVSRLRSGQSQWIRLAPPMADFALRQDCGMVTFDSSAFPDSFCSGLISKNENDCPVYALTIAEDPTTRDIVFLNADGAVIYTLQPEQGYDPYWLLNEYYPELASGLYANQEIQEMKKAYDPSRVQVTLKLLPSAYVDQYAQSKAEERIATASVNNMASLSRGISPMMMYQGPAVSNLQFVAIEQKTNGVLLTLAYPTGFTNRVDIFTCSDLVSFWWDLAVTTNVNTSQVWIEWLDTNALPQTVRFYAAGNSDLDTDGDGLSDARENYLYHTSSSTNDTDGDGLSDYYEVINLHTDPNNAKTNKPNVWISYPASESRKVWLP